MLRRADSIALVTETGTSLALPLPMPTRPSPSPTTVSAAKLSVRPPLTTLVTRLTAIIFSLADRRRCLRSARGVETLPSAIPCDARASELEAGFARGIGQRLDAAVVARNRRGRTRPSRRRRPWPSRRCACRPPPRRRRCRPCPRPCVAGEVLADVGLGGRGAGEHPRAVVGDDAGVDVQVGPVHRQARDALQRDAGARLLASGAGVGPSWSASRVAPYFFFVSLIVTFSSA